MKKYWTYTQRNIVDWNFTQDTTLNGFYDLSFFLTYPEYQLPTLTVKDWLCNNKFFIAEYDDIISEENINLYISNIPSEFNIQLLTPEQAKQFVRENYREESDGVFVLSEETTWIIWEIIPTKYIIID